MWPTWMGGTNDLMCHDDNLLVCCVYVFMGTLIGFDQSDDVLYLWNF